MAFTPVNGIELTICTKNINNSIENDNEQLPQNCHVVKSTENSIQIKKKRGRPKKTVLKNENCIQIVSNTIDKVINLDDLGNESNTTISDINNDNLIKANILPGLKSENSTLPMVRRGRGRPRKSISNIVEKAMIVPGVNILEKQERNNCTNLTEKSTLQVFNSSELMKTDENIGSNYPNNNAINFVDSVTFKELEIHSKKWNSACENFSAYSKCVSLEKIDSGTKVEKTDSTKQKNTTESLINVPDFLLELNKINCNSVLKKSRSKSLDRYQKSKMRHRRNSLSDIIKLGKFESSKSINKNYELNKYWKSLSYLEGGPNILIERYQRNELNKKFRSELKRSRSFPNCMLLDTVIWRFLVYQQTYNSDESTIELSDTEINLINELSENGYHEYRSKSEPISDLLYKKEKKKCDFKSLNNLNALCCDYYLPNISAQTCLHVTDLNNSINNEEENCQSKIRRSKRLNTKTKDFDSMLEETYLLESNKQTFDYLLHAEQIREENERQLLEAKQKDPELEEKLSKLNFTLISNNLFRPHRKEMSKFSPAEIVKFRRLKPRRTINGEAFKCNCKYSTNDLIKGIPGCGSECINRLLNIECGSSCLLKSYCTNKQFQNKQFKRTAIVRTPDKGYGVFALEDIPSESFVDEYVGEVINQHEMIRRMKTKLYNNHNYMVQLKHDEIIDATKKGNITRFINHSCEPNCMAEKWNVLGESRIGFFSKKCIHKGEEITFDYSFELFGDTKQQVCYCGASKCRGFISKKSRTDDEYEFYDSNIPTLKQEDIKGKKQKIFNTKIADKNIKRLQELDQQLRDISKLKNKNRSDLENSTLNLNKLMVHITDSISQSHILKFIRENDLNCKRLFMNFNGLSIIHSWMVSSNSESLKIEIIKTLSDLPISNKNTIAKSKVLDIVGDWAKIPLNTKKVIENLDYPESKIEEHFFEVDKLLPDENNISELVHASRTLWKKWITLKMVFKIPKLERPKEAIIPTISNYVSNKLLTNLPLILPQTKLKTVQYHFGKPVVSNQSSENIKNKFIHSKRMQGQEAEGFIKPNTIDTFIKIIHNQNQIDNRDQNKAVREWNKYHWVCPTYKTTNVNNCMSVNNSKELAVYEKNESTYFFNSINNHQEIPTIVNNVVNKDNMNKKPKIGRNIEFAPKVIDVPTKSQGKSFFTNNISEIKSTIQPIEVFISNKTWSLPIPTISDFSDGLVLKSLLKSPPPSLTQDSKTNLICNYASDSLYSALTLMNPENVLYDSQHPSTEEQISLMAIQETINNTNTIQIELLDSKKMDKRKKMKLFIQCMYNLAKLYKQGLLDISKSPSKNFVDRSPIKIFTSFFKNRTPILQLQPMDESFLLKNIFKCLKIISNFYQNQPSNLVKVCKFNSSTTSQKYRNDVFRIKETKFSPSDSILAAFKFCDQQLSTTPKQVNIKKLLKKQPIKIYKGNTFACKILHGLKKKCSAMPKVFTLKLPSDTKICTLNPIKEIEFHNKLIPTIENTLCATIKNNENTVNVFKQKLNMKYDESKLPRYISNVRSITKERQILLKHIEDNRKNSTLLKRKLPLPPMEGIKNRILADSSINHINTLKNEVSVFNQADEPIIFKKPKLPTDNNVSINTTIECQTQNSILSETAVNKLDQKPSSSDQLLFSIDQLEANLNEIQRKPLMKCLPFNKLNSVSVTKLENNARSLATSLSKNYCNNVLPSNQLNNKLINPIVDKFNTSRNLKKTMVPTTNLTVRNYIQERTELNNHTPMRKCKLPDSMMSLPADVLNLIPDSYREIKYVVDFYHSMATVIVKVLDLYVKKNCQQGRIKSDDDFKYLAKKLNSNILYKELQVKNVEDLRITDSVKIKVEQYIKKYMLKFGKVYRRKDADQ